MTEAGFAALGAIILALIRVVWRLHGRVSRLEGLADSQLSVRKLRRRNNG